MKILHVVPTYVPAWKHGGPIRSVHGLCKALAARGHQVTVVPHRSSEFGYGQATVSRPDGVHLGASEPRHDGAAIPEAPAVFTQPR